MVLLAVQMYSPASVYWMLFRVRDDTRAWLRTTMCPSRVCREGRESIRARDRAVARRPGHRLSVTSLTSSLLSLPMSKSHFRHQLVGGGCREHHGNLGVFETENGTPVTRSSRAYVPRLVLGQGQPRSPKTTLGIFEMETKVLTSKIFQQKQACLMRFWEACTPGLSFQQPAICQFHGACTCNGNLRNGKSECARNVRNYVRNLYLCRCLAFRDA